MIDRRAALAALAASVVGAAGCARAQDALEAHVASVLDPRFAGGAKADGRTDDTRAIQAAIDTASEIFIPAGIYLVRNSLKIPSRRRIFGAGAASVLKKADEVGERLIVNANPSGNTDIVIERLALDGVRRTSSNVDFRDGLYLAECENAVVRHLTVRNCLNDGIIIAGGSNNVVSDCIVIGNGKDGIYVSGSRNATVQRNQASNNLLGGIAVAATRNAIVAHNVSRGNRVDIILARDASHIEVSSNECRSTTAFAISPENLAGQMLHGKRYPARPTIGWDHLYGASFCRIHDNLFAGQVRLILLSDSQVIENFCVGSGAQGIVLQGALRNRIVSNTIRAWGKGFGGIQLASLTGADGLPDSQNPPIVSENNIIKDNIITDTDKRPAIIDGGVRTELL